ncbi:NUDIX domain-containing protein [Streptomyces sp. NPDC006173]|uniref:NUDIX hydrolase n=1 Tax=Streptomyces sp. NPDC006173 TaxID=3155349 RepID=UPI0033CFECC3
MLVAHARHDVRAVVAACEEGSFSEVELRLSTVYDGLVAGAVIVDGGRVLLIRRAVAAGSLVWSFPSGKVERREQAFRFRSRHRCTGGGQAVSSVSMPC